MTNLQKAHESLRLKRENGEAVERKNPIEKAKARPESLRLAINAMCYDCIGQDADPDWRGSIRECLCKDCPLFPVRPFQPKLSPESVDKPV
jgi:hypothetical protein